MLQTARSLGDELVLVLSNDAHNKKFNAVAAQVRMKRMRKLGLADKILVGEPDSFANSLRREKPDILTLGYDQRLPDGETKKTVEELGIQVVVLPWFPGQDQTCVLDDNERSPH